MQLLLMLVELFKSISIDFIIDLPLSIKIGDLKAFNSILVIVDKYIKIVKYIAYWKTINALELASVFIKN